MTRMTQKDMSTLRLCDVRKTTFSVQKDGVQKWKENKLRGKERMTLM